MSSAIRIQLRRDTAVDWTTANPTLAQGELGFEIDTGNFKIGDGSTAWTALGYEHSLSIQLIAWAYAEAYALISATRNSNELVTSASVEWPDGNTGTFTTTTVNSTFNAIDAYTVTWYNGIVTHTITQAAVTRDGSGGVIAQPALTVV